MKGNGNFLFNLEKYVVFINNLLILFLFKTDSVFHRKFYSFKYLLEMLTLKTLQAFSKILNEYRPTEYALSGFINILFGTEFVDCFFNFACANNSTYHLPL